MHAKAKIGKDRGGGKPDGSGGGGGDKRDGKGGKKVVKSQAEQVVELRSRASSSAATA